MTRARSTAIVSQEAPVTEYESGVKEAIDNVAHALVDVAGALCYEAATRYVGTASEQRDIAAVMFHTAQKRFGGQKYDGEPIGEMGMRELDALWTKLTGGRPRRP